jgi:hypothetical protein
MVGLVEAVVVQAVAALLLQDLIQEAQEAQDVTAILLVPQ